MHTRDVRMGYSAEVKYYCVDGSPRLDTAGTEQFSKSAIQPFPFMDAA